jgi:hypothetical protein
MGNIAAGYKAVDWRQVVQLRAVVNTVMNLQVTLKEVILTARQLKAFKVIYCVLELEIYFFLKEPR